MFERIYAKTIIETPNEIVIVTRGIVHQIINFFIGVGLVALFLLFEDFDILFWQHEFSYETLFSLLITGALLVGVGGIIRSKIQYFYVFNKDSENLYSRIKILDLQFKDRMVVSFDKISDFIIFSRDTHVSLAMMMEFFNEIVIKLFPSVKPPNGGNDFALGIRLNTGSEMRLTSFETGKEAEEVIKITIYKLRNWIGLEEDYEINYYNQSHHCPLKRSHEIAKWAILIVFLIMITYFLVKA